MSIFTTFLEITPTTTINIPWIITSGALAVSVFLVKDVYSKIKKDIVELFKEINLMNEKVEIERSRSDKEMRLVDGRINDLHINILNKLDEIKYKFNEFRK